MANFEITWLEDRSDESLLDEIRRVAALTLGMRFTRRLFDSHARITSSGVERRFGSWAEATRQAGLSDALPIYTVDAIISDIRRVSDIFHDDPFTMAVYSRQGKYSVSIIKRKFGGWRDALTKAGIEGRYVGTHVTERMKTQSGRRMTDDEILGCIRSVATKLGSAYISGADVAANSEIDQGLMHRRFGSVSAAFRKAGVEQVPHGRRYTENEIFENLLNVWTHYGRPPKVSEMDQPPSVVGPNAYINRYGRWREALKAFVARANSEAEDGPAIVSGGSPSPIADPNKSHPNLAAGTDEAGTPQSALPAGVQSRAPRPAPNNIKPEDRRDPGLGLRFKVLDRDRFKCVLCGNHPARDTECDLHVDHVIPWSKGGKTREDNLRTLCAACNVGRGNRFVG